MEHEHRCCNKQKVKKGGCSGEEDETLSAYIKNDDQVKWSSIPELTGLKRCGKTCRLRWINFLKPDIKRGNFTPEEIDLIISFQKLIGNKWSKIAKHLPGRTPNDIKNLWNSMLKHKTHESSSSKTIHPIPIIEPFDHLHYHQTQTLNQEPPMCQLYALPSHVPSSMAYYGSGFDWASSTVASNDHQQQLNNTTSQPVTPWINWMNDDFSYSTTWMNSSILRGYDQNFLIERDMYMHLISGIHNDEANSSQSLEEFDINEFFNFDLFEEDSKKVEASWDKNTWQ